ncbi:MAG: hypothetical protein K2P14_01990, partial [Anaeroplasmataceae bacterium]|nr:hypothetical protein [Anaeroplasmataceae bacterium]
MLKKYQSYLIDWHLNQRTYNIFLCFIEDYALFEEFNESQKHMGYRVSLIGKNKFKKANVNIDYSQLKIMNDFSNLYQLLEYLNEMRRIIEINTSKKCVQGYI